MFSLENLIACMHAINMVATNTCKHCHRDKYIERQLLFSLKNELSQAGLKPTAYCILYIYTYTSHSSLLHIHTFSTFFAIQNTFSVPLQMATEKGHTPTVERLLEGGADINYKNKARKE